VSTAAQKPDLANQTAALQADCEARQIKVDEWMQDIGSGLNYKRSMARIFGTDIRSSQHNPLKSKNNQKSCFCQANAI